VATDPIFEPLRFRKEIMTVHHPAEFEEAVMTHA